MKDANPQDDDLIEEEIDDTLTEDDEKRYPVDKRHKTLVLGPGEYNNPYGILSTLTTLDDLTVLVTVGKSKFNRILECYARAIDVPVENYSPGGPIRQAMDEIEYAVIYSYNHSGASYLSTKCELPSIPDVIIIPVDVYVEDRIPNFNKTEEIGDDVYGVRYLVDFLHHSAKWNEIIDNPPKRLRTHVDCLKYWLATHRSAFFRDKLKKIEAEKAEYARIGEYYAKKNIYKAPNRDVTGNITTDKGLIIATGYRRKVFDNSTWYLELKHRNVVFDHIHRKLEIDSDDEGVDENPRYRTSWYSNDDCHIEVFRQERHFEGSQLLAGFFYVRWNDVVAHW